jgi:hypothetical protein
MKTQIETTLSGNASSYEIHHRIQSPKTGAWIVISEQHLPEFDRSRNYHEQIHGLVGHLRLLAHLDTEKDHQVSSFSADLSCPQLTELWKEAERQKEQALSTIQEKELYSTADRNFGDKGGIRY